MHTEEVTPDFFIPAFNLNLSVVMTKTGLGSHVDLNNLRRIFLVSAPHYAAGQLTISDGRPR